VQFLGSYIKPNVKFIANRTKGNFYNLIKNINNEFEKYKCDVEYLNSNKLIFRNNDTF